MNKLLIVIYLILFISACGQSQGKIEINESKNQIILVNTSQTHKYRFTIKKTSEFENGRKESHISFYDLEPGDERFIGQTYSFSGDRFYMRQLYDTIKQYTHFDKIVKQTKRDIQISKQLDSFSNKPYKYTPEYFINYTKHGLNYNPVLNVFGDFGKVIDKQKIGNVQIVTYLVASGAVPDLTKPKKQMKLTYTFEIKGQRIIN